MATNYIQPGDSLTIPAPAAVASGGVVIAGSIVGIAAGDAESGASVDVVTRGVFTLPKVGANAFTSGRPSTGMPARASRPPRLPATRSWAWRWQRPGPRRRPWPFGFRGSESVQLQSMETLM